MSQTQKKMDINTIIILLIIGAAAGMLGGLVGIGGGIIIVPALILFLGKSQLQAQGISLALIMFPVGILGVMQYYKQDHVDFSIVLILAIGFIVGSFLGSKIAMDLPQDIIRKLFAGLLIIVAVKMLFLDKTKNKDKKIPQKESKNNLQEIPNSAQT
jgi:uncharacterized membrane protein YfcA